MNAEPNALRTVLWAAIEDYVGLWAVVWELNSIALPDGEDPGQLARMITRDLIDRGWVEVYRCVQPYGEMTPVDAGTVPRLLGDNSNWLEPQRGTVTLHLSATETGAGAYRTL